MSYTSPSTSKFPLALGRRGRISQYMTLSSVCIQCMLTTLLLLRFVVFLIHTAEFTFVPKNVDLFPRPGERVAYQVQS